MHQIIIGDQTHDHIVIEIPFLKNPSSYTKEDDWFNANIDIISGAFKGRVKNKVNLRFSEVRLFLKQIDSLYNSLKGTAEFTSTEEWVNISVTGDGLGSFVAKGNVIDGHLDANTISFNIKFDINALHCLIVSLKQLLEYIN